MDDREGGKGEVELRKRLPPTGRRARKEKEESNQIIFLRQGEKGGGNSKSLTGKLALSYQKEH